MATHRAATGRRLSGSGSDRTFGRSCAPGERFKRPRVNEQIGHQFSWSMHPGLPRVGGGPFPVAEVAVGITAGACAHGDAEAACSPSPVSARAPLLPRALPWVKICGSDQRAGDRVMVAVRPVWLTKG